MTPSTDLLHMLRGRGEEIERARSLPADVVDAIRREGLFRTWVPAAHGGPERSVPDGLAAISALAEADAAAGWCLMIALTNTIPAYLLPAHHAAAIYGPADAITGGFAAPMGTAIATADGGLEVTGRWAWGSGTSHCTSIAGGVRIVGRDGEPAALPDGTTHPFVFFDRADVELLDTWHVAGLSGTGSTDYTVSSAIVPEGRWVQFGRTEPVLDAPIGRMPMFGLLAAGIAAASLGIARRALAELVDLAGAKRPQGSRKVLAERQTTQVDVARIEATVRSSAAFLDATVGACWAAAVAGDPPDPEQRRLLRLAATDAVARCTDAVRRAHLVAGGAAVYLSQPIQRAFRDAHVVSQHAMAAERTYELSGRIALGLPTDDTQL